jgi:hypothetical protein
MNDWLYRPLRLAPGRLIGFGYAGYPSQQEAQARLDDLVGEGALLLDIRSRPCSRFRPQYNRTALAERYGLHYAWVQALGNQQYQHRERGILLARGHEQAIRAAVQLAASGLSLVLLCACKHEATCHRALVIQQITAWLSDERHFWPVSLCCNDAEGMAAWGHVLGQASSTLGLSSACVLQAVQNHLKQTRLTDDGQETQRRAT